MNYNHEIITFTDNHPIRLFINKIGSVEPHWHQSLEISAVINGEVSVNIFDKSYSFRKNDVFLVNSNEIHSVSGDNALLATLQIRLDRLEKLPNNTSSILFKNTFNADEQKKIRSTIATLLKFNSLDKNKNTSLLELSEIYKLMFNLFNYGISSKQLDKNRGGLSRLTSILAYVNSEYKKDISLSTIAQNEYLSEAYLSRYFKENVGMNFSSYLKKVRLGKAMEILMSSSTPINTIAERVGFPNARAFVTAFRETYGEIPSKYRKEHDDGNTIITDVESKDKEKMFNYLDNSFEEDRALIIKFVSRSVVSDNDQKTSEKEDFMTSIADITNVSIDKKYDGCEINTKNYLTMIGGGRVRDILDEETQDELRLIQMEIGFKYIKLHSVFDDDLMVVNVSEGKTTYNFNQIDKAYDFLLSVNLKPLVQLSFMPKALLGKEYHSIFLGKANIGYPADINEWNKLCSSFLIHLLDRYGKKEVDSWLFGVWNEPATSNFLFGLKDEEYYSLYKNTYLTLKSIDKDIVFGGPASFSAYGKSDTWLYDFLKFTKKENIVPDYISVHYYDVDLAWVDDPNENEKYIPNRMYLSPVEDSFRQYVVRIKEDIKSLGIDSPIYLTEWNNTASHSDLLSDTCFKSSYIVKNLLENEGGLKSFSYWTLSDRINENYLVKELFHGGPGLFFYDGIKKPSYHAFWMLNRLGNRVLAKGDGYYVTEDDNGNIQLILYYYCHYSYEYSRQMDYQINLLSRDAFFKNKGNKAIEIDFSGFEGRYLETEYRIYKDSGSAFDVYVSSGDVKSELIDTDYLKSASEMKRSYHTRNIADGMTIRYELRPSEVKLITLKKLLTTK